MLAFRLAGGYAERITVPATAVFAKPPALDHPAAANLLLAGTTAAEMLHVTGVRAGDTVVVHGASGAVGVSVLQQARELGVALRRHGERAQLRHRAPVRGRAGRLRRRARRPAARCSAGRVRRRARHRGYGRGVDVSLELVADRRRIVTIAAHARAERDGIHAIGGAMPASAAFRDEARPRLIAMAADGRLVVPVARTFPLDAAPEALALLQGGPPGRQARAPAVST